MKKYPIHPDFGAFASFTPPFCRAVFPFARLALALLPKGLNDRRIRAVRLHQDGVRGWLIAPRSAAQDLPCLVYFHGGGFAFRAARYHFENAKAYALGAECRVLLVDYRLAPRAHHPLAVEDGLAAYRFALQLGGDTLLGGDSAGGCLAAETLRRVHESGLRAPVGCLLIYPVLDRTMQTESMRRFVDTPVWNARLNARMWQYYLGEGMFVSPAEWKEVGFFPPTYLETAQFDCLHDEGEQFAQKLAAQGVAVTYHEVHSAMHGFDFVRHCSITRTAIAHRVAFLRARCRLPR